MLRKFTRLVEDSGQILVLPEDSFGRGEEIGFLPIYFMGG